MHLPDSVFARLVVYVLGSLAVLFECILLFGCTPAVMGNSSSISRYNLFEFDSNYQNQTSRLRVSYLSMCASIGYSGDEHCAITFGRSRDTSLSYLSSGQQDPGYYSLPQDQKFNADIFDIAYNIQRNVLMAFPIAPGIMITVALISLFLYGIFNRPFRAPASEFKHFSRNRTLDILRILILITMGLGFLFSFAIAVSASQLYTGIKYATNNSKTDGFLTTNPSGTTLALHWLVAIGCFLFFGGLMATVTALSKVTVAINPEATSGTSGAHSYSALDPLERVGLLGTAKPMGMMPSLMGASPQQGPRPSSLAAAGMMPGSTGMGMGMGRGRGQMQGLGAGGQMAPNALGMRGAAPGMNGLARGGAMAPRGGAMGARGAPMGARTGVSMR